MLGGKGEKGEMYKTGTMFDILTAKVTVYKHFLATISQQATKAEEIKNTECCGGCLRGREGYLQLHLSSKWHLKCWVHVAGVPQEGFSRDTKGLGRAPAPSVQARPRRSSSQPAASTFGSCGVCSQASAITGQEGECFVLPAAVVSSARCTPGLFFPSVGD